MKRWSIAVLLGFIAVVVAAGLVHSNRAGNVSPPTISHTEPGKFGSPSSPAVGDILFAGSGQWSPTPTGFAYAWKDCDSSGANCSTASGTPTNTTRYVIASGDVGSTIRVAVTASFSGQPDATVMSQPTAVVTATSEFPLQVSGNGRFLENASGQPWLMVGDSPQSVMGNLSLTNADSYFDDRESEGFDAVWVNLLCDSYTSCNTNGTTADSIAPFTSGTTPSNYSFGSGECGDCNATYFSRAHSMVAHAEADNIEVFLDPIETGDCTGGGWMDTLVNNGNGTTSTSTADYKYGQFLGTEFGDLNNITWISGNDFRCIDTAANNNDALAVAEGIQNTDPSALQTLESDFCNSGGTTCEGSSSLASTSGTDTGWESVLNLNASYVYSPTYGQDRDTYAQTPTLPMFLVEANYEGQNDPNTDGCDASDPINCRLQEWWTMTSGGTGQLYGGNYLSANGTANKGSYGISNGFVDADIDTIGASQLAAQATFLRTIAWQTLAPDANGTGHLVTSGGGSCPTTGSYTAVTCVTAATNEAGSDNLALIYMPDPSSLGTITVDLTKLTGTTTAHWVDPADGAETTASHGGTTSAATFTPTGNNSVGDKDWALLLQSS